MRIVYGIEVKESNDIYITIAERAVNSVIEAAAPGSFIVDHLPLRTSRDLIPTLLTLTFHFVFSQAYSGLVSRSNIQKARKDMESTGTRNENYTFQLHKRFYGIPFF